MAGFCNDYRCGRLLRRCPTCSQRWLTAAFILAWAWLVWVVGRIGHAIRPYDMLADRRRWFWQPRQRCGFTTVPADVMAELVGAVERRRQADSGPTETSVQ